MLMNVKVERRMQRQGVLDRHDDEASGDAITPLSSERTRTKAHSQPSAWNDTPPFFSLQSCNPAL